MSAHSYPISSKRLHLCPDVYFCIAEGQGVFLDLPHDDYCAIPMPDGFLVADGKDGEEAILTALEIHRSELIEAGLMTDRSPPDRSLRAFQDLERPVSNLFDPDDQRAFGLAGDVGSLPRIGVRDIVDFIVASRKASKLLKTRPMFEIVQGIRDSKSASARDASHINLYRHSTAVFRKLRPWHPRDYLCLYDALALLEFLARRMLYPDWVFGVQTKPFGAHCWLQVGTQLLNESTEYATRFTPIMVV